MSQLKHYLFAGAACALLAAAQLPAQTPPAGQGGPAGAGMGAGGMQPVADSKEDTERKAVVQAWGALIDQGKVDEAFQKYVSKDFTEHSYMARRMSGKDKMGYNEVLPFFTKFMAGTPGSKDKLVETLTANDEMVTYRGRKGQDILRVVNGKITDHWDTLQAQGAGGAGGPPAGGAPQGGPPPAQ